MIQLQHILIIVRKTANFTCTSEDVSQCALPIILYIAVVAEILWVSHKINDDYFLLVNVFWTLIIGETFLLGTSSFPIGHFPGLLVLYLPAHVNCSVATSASLSFPNGGMYIVYIRGYILVKTPT